ncbi:MAG: WsaE [Parcubacteria group bacterium GW2011_GWA1_36_12]|nr:MAG: WsaE [Parcubacteria group bacterium GW2011_GWA1_36_12]
MFKYFLPYDVFERHKKVGSLINKNQSVLDIGGELNHLSQFCQAKKIIIANLTSGDVIIPKGKLPFTKNSFVVVCSIDVLEHIPKKKRQEFVASLVRIASNKVILSFPVGTRKHIKYEKLVQIILKKKGKSVKYLNEHIHYGLPSQKEIRNMFRSYKTEISYSGNIKINELLFKLFIFDPKIKFVRRIIFFSKLVFNLFTNQLLYIILSNKTYSVSINRAFVIINKQQ